MRKIYLVLSLLLSVQAFTQIKIEGVVTDSIGLPLDVANVVAINAESQLLESFGISDSQGYYKINLKSETTYQLKFSYLGFKPKEFNLTTEDQDILFDVVLEAQPQNLDEVEVVYEIPITIQGDTIVYNTDSFVSGTEKKLEDVLDKLPGVEVNDDGQIEVEGKRVTKVMVEGEDFFDGDSKLAAKNIPADALKKVEVLRNYTEVSQLSSVTNNQDNIALNIKLKEGKKKFWFGEISAGLGNSDRYSLHPKLFYYSPKYSLSLLTDANNIGEVAFSGRDYWSFTGGFRGATNQNTGTNFSTTSAGLGLSLTQNNTAKSVVSKFAALNFSYKPSEKWLLTGFGIFSDAETEIERLTRRTFVTTNLLETVSTNNLQNVALGIAKFSTRFKPSDRFQWEYDVLVRTNEERERSNTLTQSTVTDLIEENQNQKPVTISQSSNVYWTLNDSNIIAAELKTENATEDPFYQSIRQQQPFLNLIPFDQTQNFYNINQAQDVTTKRVDLKLDYFLITSPNTNLNITLGGIESNQEFNSSIFQRLDNNQNLDFNSAQFNNDVAFNFKDRFVGLYFKAKYGDLTINPGLLAHRYTTNDQQLGEEITRNYTHILPEFFANYQFKQSESIRLNYRVTRSFTDVNNFAEGLLFNNYNVLFAGNRNLESALFHSLNLSFFSFNMFSQRNIFFNASYNKRIDALKSSALIGGINQVRTTINSNFQDESASFSGNYQQTFGRIKIGSRAGVNYSNTFNVINDRAQNSQSLNHNYLLSLGSSFVNAPNLELGYRFAVSDYNTGTTSSIFYTERPYLKFDAAFLKHFVLVVDYDYYNYYDKADTVSNSYSFLNANLSFQKDDSKWEFILEAKNLGNNRNLNQDSFNELFFNTSQYIVQPRFIVFKLKYNL